MANQQQITLPKRVLFGYIAFLLFMWGMTMVAWLWPDRPFWARLVEPTLYVILLAIFLYVALKNRAS